MMTKIERSKQSHSLLINCAFVLILFLPMFIYTRQGQAEESGRKTYAEWHLEEKNGLGFGLGVGSLSGIILFYDRNLSDISQLHIQLNGGSDKRTSLFGTSSIETTRSMFLATYRYFPVENRGFYIGGGGGTASSTLDYKDTTKYSAKANGVFLTGEFGWQGIEGYYFHIGYQPSFYIISKDDYDVEKIPDVSNHRSTANEVHDNTKNLGMLSIGFGWFF